jgi:hypothetical protein
MLKIHRHFADNTHPHSVATQLRRRRFQLFVDLLWDLPRPIKILDIGGRQKYWEMVAGDLLQTDDLRITLLNVEEPSVSHPSFTGIRGDGRSLPQMADGQFDVVFSNSTIEHVGTLDDQHQMAREVRRVGKRYYVQTPNRRFPIEPHFLFPGFQYLPVRGRAWLLRHFRLGWFEKTPDPQEALRQVTGIRLLTKTEVRRLFPEANIFEERWCGLTKSFVAFTPACCD